VFPDALFIHVTRDIYDTVASVMKGRAKHGITDDEWWGVPPPHYIDHAFNSVLERVVHQVWDVRRYAAECLDVIDAHRRLTLAYEDFCAQPSSVIDWIRSTYKSAGVVLERQAGGAGQPNIRRPARAPERAQLEAEVAGIVASLERERT
jgi:hypothetical protein